MCVADRLLLPRMSLRQDWSSSSCVTSIDGIGWDGRGAIFLEPGIDEYLQDGDEVTGRGGMRVLECPVCTIGNGCDAPQLSIVVIISPRKKMFAPYSVPQ